jgi:hypothetical protein
LGLNVRRWRNVAGLASAAVPCAIVVHLSAEAAAAGREGFGFDFVVRHAYFAVLVVAAAWWFGSTAGIGHAARERRRRCAVLRADFAGVRRPQGFLMLAAAELAFFGLTQAVEGVPIASGAVALGLAVAFAGSLLSAFLVFFFGRSLVVAGLDSVIGTAPLRPAAKPLAHRARVHTAARRAASAFTLFVPNRPPPFMSPL